jgi:hypothetical protein
MRPLERDAGFPLGSRLAMLAGVGPTPFGLPINLKGIVPGRALSVAVIADISTNRFPRTL